MNDLRTVFDITVTSNGIGDDAWFRIAIGIGTAIVGVIWLVRVLRMRAGWRQAVNAFVLVGLGAIWLIVTLPMWMASRDRQLLIQLSGQGEVTEGIVHVAHMQPPHGHAAGDKITIGDQHFEINYFLMTPGYRQTIAHGGVLREGVYARLHHYDGVIIKVEVPPGAAAP